MKKHFNIVLKIFIFAIFILILTNETSIAAKLGEKVYFKQSDLYTDKFYCLDPNTLIPKTRLPYNIVGILNVDTEKSQNPISYEGNIKIKENFSLGMYNDWRDCVLGLGFSWKRAITHDALGDVSVNSTATSFADLEEITGDIENYKELGYDYYKNNSFMQNLIWSAHNQATYLSSKDLFDIIFKMAFRPTYNEIIGREKIEQTDNNDARMISATSNFENKILANEEKDKLNVDDYYIIGPYKYTASQGDYIKEINVSYNGKKQVLSKDFKDIMIVSRVDMDSSFLQDYDNIDFVITSGRDNPTINMENDIDSVQGVGAIFAGLSIYGKKNGMKFGYKPEFYILVRKDAKITSIDELKVTIGRDQIKGEIAYYKYKKGEIDARKYINQNGKWGEQGDNSQEGCYVNFEWKTNTEDLVFKNIPLIPPVQVELNKVDTIGSAVEGAKFTIKYSNGLSGETITADKNGKVTFTQVQPQGPEEFTATITETSTPAGYKSLEKPIKLKFTYNESSAEWKVTKIENESDENAGTPSVTNSSGTNVVNLKVTNKSIIEKLTLLKTSTVTELGAVKGAQFKLTLTNVASIKGYTLPTIGETKTIIVTTNSSGQIVLEDIEIADLNKEITITMEETYAPIGYKKIEGTITLTLKRQGNTYTVAETKTEGNVLENEFESGKVTLTNHELTLNIKDIPIMNLGGIVWVEKEKTGKTPTSSDIYGDGNEEEALGGVTVKLYKGTKEIATTTSSDGNATATYKNNKGESITVTLKQGEYMFTDIEAGNDYHVEFEYDGILYKALLNTNAYTTTKDSKIKVEPNRDDFNKATTTISGSGEVDKSTTNNGWTIEYNLDNNSTPYKAIYKDVKDANNNAQFVKAKTYTYLKETKDWLNTWNNDGTINTSHYAFNINCGLCEKYFDLNLGTDVASATVKINGQETKYTYDQILDGKLNEALNKSSDSSVDYNLYLAYSDYYYRIDDYKMPDDTQSPINNKYDTETDYSEIKNKKANTELEIYVTYRLVLNNQSTHNATVDLVEYKYDEHYEFLQENNTNIKLAEGTNLENRVLMIDTSDLKLENGGQQSIELTFKVLPDKESNKCVLDEDYLNQAEIVSYSTEEGGLVDADSAPGNAFLTSDVRYEDDTDEANGIEITFKEEAERSISGKVFDDDKYSKDAVNDVIVQLIELIEINGKQYEYIWQETVAGSKTVKTTVTSGGREASYTVNNNADGEYQFTQGIIPGDYIVRFIYGDGSTYDLTGNVKTYNGEDYKSTYVDYNYNAEWYNTETLNGEKSKAVDNEARRLKVMSYAVDVNGELGAKLALLDDENITGENEEGLKNVLSNTWMCAETLKIKMTVDTDNQETISDTATVANGTSPTTQNTQFTNVNFGLMKRPQTKLVLEKHITGLTIKPVASGVSLIANATVDIDKILELNEGDQIKTLEGQRDGLSATKSGRNQRAMWYLQTDTTELAQGADAYITYTYVVKNKGDKDYLNKDLVDYYKAVEIDEYKNKLSELETEVKNAKKSKIFTNGTYISEFYYTETPGINDQEVLASVEEIQEALNPKVKFVDSTTDFNKTARENLNNYAYYDTNGTLQANEDKITEIITSKTGTTKLKITENDTSKKLVVSVGLSASEIENGGVFDSYIAEVTHYTNAAGRRDQSTPANLSYVHSYDTNETLANNNEEDEFWAETFRITKPTGEDKQAPVQIAIITITSIAVLGIGIILIKKFVLKK